MSEIWYNKMKCRNCGAEWEVREDEWLGCPFCNPVIHQTYIVSTRKVVIPDSDPKSESASVSSNSFSNSNPQPKPISDFGLAIFFGAVALVLSPILLFFTGCMTSMLFLGGDHYESRVWSWIACIGISLVYFAFCGFKVKRYMVLNAILVIVMLVLSWCISDFSPITYARESFF